MRGGSGSFGMPSISYEREPLSDVSITNKEVRVAVEMPGVAKENIKIQAHDDKVEVTSNDPQRKYHEVVNIPPEADIETIRSIYNNGFLEIVFKKKEQAKSGGKEIRIDRSPFFIIMSCNTTTMYGVLRAVSVSVPRW
jgi:HSP20 family protein